MVGTLAQTIQGEASDPAGQFAVAATIYNRMLAGTFPGGTDPNAIVNAPFQYTGFSATPSANAQALADAIQSGTLNQFGNPGNAVNFQSGSAAAASGLNQGTNIGGNFFSNLFGPPSPNFVAPNYTGGLQNAAFPAGPGQTPPNASSGSSSSSSPSFWQDPLGYIGNFFWNVFTRVAVILMGVILIWQGLAMLRSSQTVTNITENIKVPGGPGRAATHLASKAKSAVVG